MIEHTYHNEKYVFVQYSGAEYSYDRETGSWLSNDIPDTVREEVEDYVKSRLT